MTIQEILSKREDLKVEIDKYDKLINAYRDVCNHNWEYEGHTSHADIYKCTICKDTKREIQQP